MGPTLLQKRSDLEAPSSPVTLTAAVPAPTSPASAASRANLEAPAIILSCRRAMSGAKMMETAMGWMLHHFDSFLNCSSASPSPLRPVESLK